MTLGQVATDCVKRFELAWRVVRLELAKPRHLTWFARLCVDEVVPTCGMGTKDQVGASELGRWLWIVVGIGDENGRIVRVESAPGQC